MLNAIQAKTKVQGASVFNFVPQHGYNDEVIQSQLEVSYNCNILSDPLSCSEQVYTYYKRIWDKERINLQEQAYVLYLNNQFQVIGWKCLNTGNYNSVVIDLKLALSIGLTTMASNMIIAHNHPSGNLKPSKEDIMFVNRLKHSAALFDINLIESLIITDNGYCSFVDEDLFKN